ncbi:abhydrolase domain-containing protein 9 [Venturia nashicola]|uniref:Abhydrolase domain-containing protein 9 n=1 Tax=Venturia nashicola TaxID=86259 RepID=A0A4Z1P5Z8_9PEZI|nr:abhydrolase domain-containing protein 9 [Venturia nashicola]
MPTHVIDVPSKPTRSDLVVRLLWHAFSFAYGTATLVGFILLAVVRKPSFRRFDNKSRKELAIARDKLWNLDCHPGGLNHRFCTLRNGIKLHYVEALPHNPSAGNTSLVIFLHGFPDSWVLWQQYLCGNLRDSSLMVACDLPGFGGSDSLAKYGPNEVLEVISEYIIQMREKYLNPEDENAKVIVAAHDWGAVIGFRLASEAPELADRFILSNAIHPAFANSNVKDRLAAMSQMIHTWPRMPLRLCLNIPRLLRNMFSTASPLLRQFIKSGYIFVFQLPRPMVNSLAAVGEHWFFRYLNALAMHPDPSKPLEGSLGAELLASSTGPSMEECVTNGKEDLTYPASVRKRAQNGAWFEKVRVYRDGLAFSPWEKSIETLWDLTQIQPRKVRRRSFSRVALFDTGPEGTLRAPTTVIWGQDDIAIERSIAVQGIKDIFGCRSSQLIEIPNCGHWSPLEKNGALIFERVIAWAAGGEVGSLVEKLFPGFDPDHASANHITEK